MSRHIHQFPRERTRIAVWSPWGKLPRSRARNDEAPASPEKRARRLKLLEAIASRIASGPRPEER